MKKILTTNRLQKVARKAQLPLASFWSWCWHHCLVLSSCSVQKRFGFAGKGAAAAIHNNAHTATSDVAAVVQHADGENVNPNQAALTSPLQCQQMQMRQPHLGVELLQLMPQQLKVQYKPVLHCFGPAGLVLMCLTRYTWWLLFRTCPWNFACRCM